MAHPRRGTGRRPRTEERIQAGASNPRRVLRRAKTNTGIPNLEPGQLADLAAALNSPEEDSKIRILTPQGETVRLIDGPPNEITHLDWHPDGTEILITARKLWTMEPEAGEIVPLEKYRESISESMGIVTNGAWSPDGQRIAIRNGSRLVVMDRDGGNARLIHGARRSRVEPNRDGRNQEPPLAGGR